MDSIESSYKRLKEKFRKCTTNLQRTNFFISEIWPNIGPKLSNHHNSKNDQKSIEIRETGNTLFKNQKYTQALENYTLSIAWAKSKKIAALGYSNRSAALSKLGLHKECLIDIDRAFMNGYPEETKAKLVSRRREASRMQKHNRAEKKPEVIKTNKIEIHKNEKYGRHLIATCDIKIGEILVSENPVALVLMRDHYIYCHQCLAICYNLIPCDNCPNVLYCSKKCKQKAFKNYHKYECYILNVIESLESMKYNLAVSLKTTLQILNELKNNGKSRHYEEIKQSVAHSDQRPLRALFAISWMSSMIFQFLKLSTPLFDEFMDYEDTFKELYPLCVQVTHINGVLLNRLEPKSEGGYDSVVYAQGLYLSYSRFNHSCYPNAFFYHEGSTLVVRALGSIKKGEQCYISYRHTYSTIPKRERQLYLLENFYFKCTCRACTENWPQEEDNDAFDEPFAYVAMAQQQNDRELLQKLVPTFIKRLQSFEKYAPASEISCLRQLIVDCYLDYTSPWKFFSAE